MITLSEGSPPTLTYNQSSVTCLEQATTAIPKLANKLSVVGLGHVISCKEVVHNTPTSTTRLEVIVAHNDWDSREKNYRSFNIKYIVPGSRNLINTLNIYQPGREVHLTGSLVDFDIANKITIVVVHYVSLTSGHNIGRSSQLFGSTPSPAAGGRRIVSFGKQAKGKPAGNSGGSNLESPVASTSAPARGKAREVPKHASARSPTTSEDSSSELDSAIEETAPSHSPAKAGSGRPRKEVLKAAAKHMKMH